MTLSTVFHDQTNSQVLHFLDRRKPEKSKKTFEARTNPTTDSMCITLYMTPGPGVKREPHWCEVKADTTMPLSLPSQPLDPQAYMQLYCLPCLSA